MRTQAQMVLDRLIRGELLTQESVYPLGIMRLTNRIGELKEKGHEIVTMQLHVPGKSRWVGQYRLIKLAKGHRG